MILGELAKDGGCLSARTVVVPTDGRKTKSLPGEPLGFSKDGRAIVFEERTRMHRDGGCETLGKVVAIAPDGPKTIASNVTGAGMWGDAGVSSFKPKSSAS